MRDDPEDGASDLCLANVKGDETDVTCIDEPSFAVIRALHWAQDGRSILGVRRQAAGPGAVRHRALAREERQAGVLARPAGLDQGPLPDRHRHAGQGRARRRGLARRQAARADLQPGLDAFQLWLADDPDDFALRAAKRTPVRACKVSWRSDSQELLVVQADADVPRRTSPSCACAGQRPAQPEGAERLGRRPVVPAADAPGADRRAVPQLPSPARAGSELLRQLRDAPERRRGAAGARAGRCHAGAGRR